MKKLFCMLYVFIYCAMSLYSQDFINVSGSLEIGIFPTMTIKNSPRGHENNQNILYAQYAVNIDLFNFVNIETFCTTNFFKEKNSLYFQPVFSMYGFGVSLDITENLVLGYQHQCNHPTITYIGETLPSGFSETGGYDKIYLKIKF